MILSIRKNPDYPDANVKIIFTVQKNSSEFSAETPDLDHMSPDLPNYNNIFRHLTPAADKQANHPSTITDRNTSASVEGANTACAASQKNKTPESLHPNVAINVCVCVSESV